MDSQKGVFRGLRSAAGRTGTSQKACTPRCIVKKSYVKKLRGSNAEPLEHNFLFSVPRSPRSRLRIGAAFGRPAGSKNVDFPDVFLNVGSKTLIFYVFS